MPAQLWLEEGVLNPYMSFHELENVPSSKSSIILSAMPTPASWSRHTTASLNNETNWYPSALSYGKLIFF